MVAVFDAWQFVFCHVRLVLRSISVFWRFSFDQLLWLICSRSTSEPWLCFELAFWISTTAILVINVWWIRSLLRPPDRISVMTWWFGEVDLFLFICNFYRSIFFFTFNVCVMCIIQKLLPIDSGLSRLNHFILLSACVCSLILVLWLFLFLARFRNILVPGSTLCRTNSFSFPRILNLCERHAFIDAYSLLSSFGEWLIFGKLQTCSKHLAKITPVLISCANWELLFHRILVGACAMGVRWLRLLGLVRFGWQFILVERFHSHFGLGFRILNYWLPTHIEIL